MNKQPTKKEVIENLLYNAEIKLMQDEIMEGYYQCKYAFENARYAQPLGQIQSIIKENKSMINYFKSEIDELSKNK